MHSNSNGDPGHYTSSMDKDKSNTRPLYCLMNGKAKHTDMDPDKAKVKPNDNPGGSNPKYVPEKSLPDTGTKHGHLVPNHHGSLAHSFELLAIPALENPDCEIN